MRRKRYSLWKVLIALEVLYICAIAIAGLNAIPRASDMAVVLGNDLKHGAPGARLEARLDAALSLYNHHQVTRIMVSGGIESGGADESAAMAEYLVEHGVPLSAILLDPKGKNTMATAVNTAEAMQEYHLKSVIIVTQYFHIPRCYLAFRRVGIKDFSAAYPPYYEWHDILMLIRESVALPWYAVRKVSD